MNGCAIVQIVATTVLQLLAVILLIAAVATPEWLMMFDPPSGQYHKHGLWQVCVQEGYRDQGSHYFLGTTTEKCTFLTWPPCRMVISATRETAVGSGAQPFSFNQLGNYPNGGVCELTGDQYLHHFNDFNLPVLVLLCFAAFLTLVNVLVACCGALNKAASACWCALAFIAAILSMSAIITYGINANYAQIRYITLTTTLNAQYYGYSFYLAVAGMVMLVLNSLLSIFCTVMMYSSASRERVQRYASSYIEKVPWYKDGGRGAAGGRGDSNMTAAYKKEPLGGNVRKDENGRWDSEPASEKVYVISHSERGPRMTEGGNVRLHSNSSVGKETTYGQGTYTASMSKRADVVPNLTGSQNSVGYHSHSDSVSTKSENGPAAGGSGGWKSKASNVRRYIVNSIWNQESGSSSTTTTSAKSGSKSFGPNNAVWNDEEAKKKREANSFGEFDVKKFQETPC